MRDNTLELPVDRSRIGWWLFVLVLAAAAAFLAYSFVGVVVLGVFGYYATRPVHDRLTSVLDSDGLAAWLTLLAVLLPLVLLVCYAGFQLFNQLQQVLGEGAGLLASVRKSLNLGALPPEQRRTLASLLQNPMQIVTNPRQVVGRGLQIGMRVASVLFNALFLLGLALTLSYFLLRNEDALSEGLVSLFGGRDTAAYAYAGAVDEDLESVFFGNVLFVLVMALVAVAAYGGTNLLAPQGLRVPMLFVLAFLTGVASLIPIVVGKVVYLPVVAYLALQATRTGGNQLPFVGAVLVVYFLVLDVLPQTFVQPYITGRKLDTVLMMFAYLLGPALFGWYGFFLMPIVFVLMLEAVRIVLPELVRGEALTPTVSMGESIGADPPSTGDAPSSTPDDSASRTDAASTDERTATDDAGSGAGSDSGSEGASKSGGSESKDE